MFSIGDEPDSSLTNCIFVSRIVDFSLFLSGAVALSDESNINKHQNQYMGICSLF
jgi:hypothetical protein